MMLFLQLALGIQLLLLSNGNVLLNRFTKTIHIFSFEIDQQTIHNEKNPRRESCFFVGNQMQGILQEFSLLLSNEENPDSRLEVVVRSDSGHCIFCTSSPGEVQERNNLSCPVSKRNSLEFSLNELSQRTFRDQTDLPFDRSLEICVMSLSPRDHFSGEMTIHLQHLLLEFPKLTLGSSFQSYDAFLPHDTPIEHLASHHLQTISSALPKQQNILATFESISSSPITVFVNSLLDTLPNISSCAPSSPTRDCNIRSAIAFCNHTLSLNSSITCIVDILPASRIILNSSFEAMKVDANSGELQILGNGCEILPLGSTSIPRFLDISPLSPSLSLIFRFENCTISKFGSSLDSGGGLKVQQINSVSLRDLKFISNQARSGGGVSLDNITLVELEDCLFLNNSATMMGGGMIVDNMRLSGMILRSQFSENKANEFGGGIFWKSHNHNLHISNSKFHDNIVTTGGGGGMSFGDFNSNISIVNTDFLKNIGISWSSVGGAISFETSTSNVIVKGGIFDGNKAGFAGVFMFRSISSLLIEESLFTHSSSVYDGSVMQITGSHVLIQNSIFSNNQKPTINNPKQEIYLFDTIDVTILNCSFQNNSRYLDVASHNERLRIMNSNFTSDRTTSLTLSAITIDDVINGTIEKCVFFNGLSTEGGALKLAIDSGSLLVSDCEFVGNEAEWGGAVSTTSSKSVIEFMNCIFHDNKARTSGGAIYLGDAAQLISFQNCQFFGNEAAQAGGAIYMFSEGILVVNSTAFIENKALNLGGGAIYSDYHSTITILSCVVRSNEAHSGGGGMEFGDDHLAITIQDTSFISNEARLYGIGGLRINSNNQNIFLQNCLFLRNVGSTSGGCSLGSNNLNIEFRNTDFFNNIAEYEGGGIFIDSFNIFLNLYDCRFENNTADVGAGISIGVENALALIFNCSFVNNVAINEGGGIFILSWNGVIISNSLILDNHGTHGGGLYIYSNNAVSLQNLLICNNSATDKGGGIYLSFQNSNNYYEKLQLTSNSATNGGGLYLRSGNEKLLLFSSHFTRNTALEHGGGMFIQDSNVGVTIEFCFFEENVASLYGGGILLQSANYEFLLISSTMRRNSAKSAGGSIHSSLSNENLTIMKSEFFESSAEYGGSLYIGNDHRRVLLDEVVISRSSGSVGGGLFVTPFNDQLDLVNCTFLECSSLEEGAAMYSYADVNTLTSTEISGCRSSTLAGVYINGMETYVTDSIFQNNFATDVDATGCLTISEGDVLHLHGTQFLSSGSYSGGALTTLLVNEIQITSCEFLNIFGSIGGAALVEDSVSVEITSTNFVGSTGEVGGAIILTSVQSLLINQTSFLSNFGDYYGGAMIILGSNCTLLNSCFVNNTASRGDAAAVYIDSSSVSLLFNQFQNNSANLGGGTLYWVSSSAMSEPSGLQDPKLNQFALNSASYGPNWATEGSQLATPSLEYEVTEYGTSLPSLLVSLLDQYGQLVNTHSSFVIQAVVSSSQICDSLPGYVTGEISEVASNGIANFSSLQVYCAPGFSLSLQFLGFVYDNIAISTSVTLHFRNCVRGEYYSAQECIPCELGTYSLSDETTDLSQMNQISVCQSCPPHTISCEAAELVLEKGYWRISVDSDYIQACPFGESACLGGTAVGDASCEVGYEGPLCAVCSSGYGLHPSTKTCVPCSGASSGLNVSDMILFSVIAVLAIWIIFYFTRPEIRSQIKSMDDLVLFVLTKLKFIELNETTNRREILLFTKTLSRRIRARIKVYVTMYQILSALPFVLDLSFPSPVTVIISALNFINFSLSGTTMVSCTAQSYNFIDSLLFDTIYPIVVAILLFAARWIHIQILRFRSRRKEDRGEEGIEGKERQESSNEEKLATAQESSTHPSQSIENHISNVSSTYFSIFLIFTYLILPSVVTKIFQTFRSALLSLSCFPSRPRPRPRLIFSLSHLTVPQL
jgi:predicted outer membrane repeat protein